MELEQLMKRVKQQSGRYKDLSARSGISESWLSKFGRGVIHNPTIRTLTALQAALRDMGDEGRKG